MGSPKKKHTDEFLIFLKVPYLSFCLFSVFREWSSV